jgi:hypothetical protein
MNEANNGISTGHVARFAFYAPHARFSGVKNSKLLTGPDPSRTREPVYLRFGENVKEGALCSNSFHQLWA